MTLDLDSPVRPWKSHAYYLREAFEADTSLLIESARVVLATTDFDTIVCTGLSGMLVAPILWRGLDVPYFAVVRKPEDQDNHSDRTVEGLIGRRWLFVDDLVASGRTRKRVRDAVERAAGDQTEFVGTYEYHYSKFWDPCSRAGSEAF